MTTKKKKTVPKKPERWVRQHSMYELGSCSTDMETPDPKSMTVPDMATPLQELLDRWVAGREIPVLGDPVYDGHLNLPDVRTMDKIEKEEYSRSVRAGIKELQQKMQAAEAKKQVDKIEQLQAKIAELEKLKPQNEDESNMRSSASDARL